jgi:DNA-directed RNA polymerase specialized sigma24 family protein
MADGREADTSASLLLRIRDPHDNAAWATFVGVYSPLVSRYCVRKGFQSADADDVAQEVFARVARSIASFDYAPEKGRFRGWLGTITAHAMASHRTPHSAPLLADPPQPDPEWNRDFAEHVLAVAMDRVRGEFEPATWAAFEGTWVRQEAAADVAARLGVAIHAVYVNKSRVLKRLEAEVLALAEDVPL